MWFGCEASCSCKLCSFSGHPQPAGQDGKVHRGLLADWPYTQQESTVLPGREGPSRHKEEKGQEQCSDLEI